MEYNTWLMGKFSEWERKNKRRESYSSFARYLDVKQSSLSQWLAGNYPPSKENVEKIAAKLGPEIYDILGLPRPDPDLEYWREKIESVPPENREELKDVVEEWMRKHGFVRKK